MHALNLARPLYWGATGCAVDSTASSTARGLPPFIEQTQVRMTPKHYSDCSKFSAKFSHQCQIPHPGSQSRLLFPSPHSIPELKTGRADSFLVASHSPEGRCFRKSRMALAGLGWGPGFRAQALGLRRLDCSGSSCSLLILT